MHSASQKITGRPAAPRGSGGFTLIELLVVMAILSLLITILLPSLTIAKEIARATKVHAELYGLGTALEMYATDQNAAYPPVRVSCNTDMLEHWCQLPVELAAGGYVPQGDGDTGLAAAVEDEFNPGHTYKYAAPGPCLLNGSWGDNYEMWIPDDFPYCRSATGEYNGDEKNAAVKWAVWSLGPTPKSTKSQSPYSPLSMATWYTKARDTGVLVRYAGRKGSQYTSQ